MTLKNSLLGALLIWNVVVFFTYGYDKRQAKKGAWRISEKALLLDSLCFGGLGALLAGRVFRHKTRKWYFQVCWYLGLIIDLASIYFVIWRI